jgi:hypothetical protein
MKFGLSQYFNSIAAMIYRFVDLDRQNLCFSMDEICENTLDADGRHRDRR